MPQSVTYLHLKPEAPLPEILQSIPNRIVVVVDALVSQEWQWIVSDWIIASGCLYMMAWGLDCSSWDDSVDMAKLEKFDFNDIPEDCFVMTTWHPDESLEVVFWLAKNDSNHPTVVIRHTVLLHISVESRELELLSAYAEA